MLTVITNTIRSLLSETGYDVGSIQIKKEEIEIPPTWHPEKGLIEPEYGDGGFTFQVTLFLKGGEQQYIAELPIRHWPENALELRELCRRLIDQMGLPSMPESRLD